MEKKIYRFILLFLCIYCAVTVKMAPLHAEDKNKIRVGFNISKGFHELDELGNPTGYDVEYLNKISEKNGWEYEYIGAESWEKAVEMLELGEIDILAPAQISQERLLKFDFSAYSIGMEYGSLLALQTSEDLIYEDFSKFSDLKIGCVKEFVFVKEFEEYAKNNGFTANLFYYKNTNELIAGLRSGEVDAIIANLMVADEDMKLLAKYKPAPFYYMLKKGNSKILRELNYAISEINLNNVGFEEELIRKYFPKMHKNPLSKADLEYIKNLGSLKVAYISNLDPLSYQNQKNGEFAGITKEILDLIQKNSGLQFEYVALPEGKIDLEYLNENQIDLISSVEYNDKNLQIEEISLTNPYLDSKKVIIAPSGTIFNPDKNLKLAISTGSVTIKDTILSKYPKLKIMIYDSLEDCFEAVVNKEADVLMQNQYAVERFLLRPKYKNLITIPVEGIEDKMCLSYIFKSKNPDKEAVQNKEQLISILNKSIQTISENEISSIISNDTIVRHYNFTPADLFYEYRYSIFICTIICFFLGMFILYSMRMKVKNTKIIKESEIRLRSIANNINGGVVVLNLKKEMRITYVNEGFLKLLGYTKEEYKDVINIDYQTFIHPKDLYELNSLIAAIKNKEERISLRMRLQRKEGYYISILFNGTKTEGVEGETELYGVIVDITEQTEILKKLEMEQEKYQIIMDNADEMIFELKMTGIKISRRFEEKFGWTFPKDIVCENVNQILSNWKLHKEDMGVLKEALLYIEKVKQPRECEVRIETKNGKYLWCKVSLYPIHNIGEGGIWAVGRIIDIDTLVKEREELMKISATDSLTNLLHKTAFMEECKEYLSDNPILYKTAILFLDLDNFRNVNNLLGHMIGDRAICDTARKLSKVFTEDEILSRFGGDEFCILVKNTEREQLEDKLSFIVEDLSRTYADKNHEVAITVSIGVVFYSNPQETMRDLMIKADKALYSAKESGKSRYVIYYDNLILKGYKGNLEMRG